MFLVDTQLKLSPIHGIGCFLSQPIKKGDTLWVFDPEFDKIILEENFDKLPFIAKKFIKKYGYFHPRFNFWIICADNARFINHSDNPNMDGKDPEYDYALYDMKTGTELTIDYTVICKEGKSNWEG